MALQALSRELLALQGALTTASACSGRSIAAALSGSLGARAGALLEVGAEETSTSYAASSQPWATATALLSPRRGYKKYMVNRPNLAQPIDVNTLDDLLRKATTPESAALPVLKYAGLLNPRQTAYMLQKLPRMEQLYRLRYGAQYDESQRDAYRALMYSLQQRLAQVLPDCSGQQLEQALWGLTTAGQQSRSMAEHLLPGSSSVASGLSQWLSQQAGSAQASPRVLSHAAWYLAANGAGQQAAMDQVAQLVATADQQSLAGAAPPDQQPASSTTRARSRKKPAPSSPSPLALMSSLGAGFGVDGEVWDHRTLCRLAWAFSHAGRGPQLSSDQAAAWARVCSEAAVAMETLFEQGPGASRQLQPRRRYAYNTVRGAVLLSAPMTYRPSKYRRFNGPRVSTASFDLSSAASLLSSLARAGVRDERCLRAVERLVTAMLPAPAAAPANVAGGPGVGGPASGRLLSDQQLRALAALPGTVGGVARGPSGKLLPLQPGSSMALPLSSAAGDGDGQAAAVLPPGAARYKFGAIGDVSSLGKQAAGHLLSSFYTLKYRSPALAAAVVRSTLFSQFEDADAPQLAALAYMASAVGLRTGVTARGSMPGTTTTLPDDEEVKRLMGRLLLAAAPLLPAMARRDAALLGVAAARAGLQPGDEGAVAQLVGRVVALGLEADEPAVVTALKAALQA